MYIRLTCCLLFLLPMISQGNDYPATTPAEKYLLELITRDTTSSTVAYLPVGFNYGVYKNETYFILVKSGRKNYFILNGTQSVFTPDPADPTAGLVRIDRSGFFGDNYNPIAFFRKDSLFQYGGYGFWANRDFFSYYRPLLGDWDFYRGGDAKQGILSIHYYDKGNDQLYLAGTYSHNEHASSTSVFQDSAYRYDFKTRKWSTLGKLNQQVIDLYDEFKGKRFWISPFGMCIWHNKDQVVLLDLKENKIYNTPDSFRADILHQVNYREIRDESFLPIYLKDSLYLIWDYKNELAVAKVRLSKKDFNQKGTQSIYIRDGKPSLFSTANPSKRILYVSLIMGMVVLVSFWRFRKRYFNNSLAVNEKETVNPAASEKWRQSPEKHTITEIDPQHFLDALTPVELELVRELARFGLQGKTMDITEINRILGVSQKEPELQKVRRSMTITRINTLYNKILRQEAALIEREKDDLDKRVFNYYIDPSRLHLIKDQLKVG